jgi:hypothetical protein
MRARCLFDLPGYILMAIQTQHILAGFQGLVAVIALCLKIGMRNEARQGNIIHGLGTQPPGAESCTTMAPKHEAQAGK